jgi:hypothetical protein
MSELQNVRHNHKTTHKSHGSSSVHGKDESSSDDAPAGSVESRVTRLADEDRDVVGLLRREEAVKVG